MFLHFVFRRLLGSETHAQSAFAEFDVVLIIFCEEARTEEIKNVGNDYLTYIIFQGNCDAFINCIQDTL